MLINNTEYTNPYIKIATRDMAELILDAISYRMNFSPTEPTTRLAELIPFEDGFIFPHPAGTGFIEWEEVMKGVTSYTIIDYSEV